MESAKRTVSAMCRLGAVLRRGALSRMRICCRWARFGQSKGSHTHFTKDEQYTVMTLWSICRSPLIFGGDLPQNDAFTLSLMTNDEVIAVDQHSSGGRQLFRRDDLIAWTADVDGSKDKYLAVFNARDEQPAAVSVVVEGYRLRGSVQGEGSLEGKGSWSVQRKIRAGCRGSRGGSVSRIIGKVAESLELKE